MAYDCEMTPAQAGQKYDIRPDVVQSYAAEEKLQFGDPVMRGTDPAKQCLLSDMTGFLGIALFTHTATDGEYAINDTVSVLTKGAAWVKPAVTVTAGDAAYVTATGTYTNVESTNLLVGKFITSGDTLVVLELA